MITYTDLNALLKSIDTPFGTFRAAQEGRYPENPAYWLQFVGKPEAMVTAAQEWRGRKWRISAHMTDREIVATAFQAVLSFMEHEVRESFLFHMKPIFGPHIPLDALLEAASAKPDARE